MKTLKKTAAFIMAVIMLGTAGTAFAEEFPRESLPENATQEAVDIATGLMGDVLEDVTLGLGYADARARTNLAIRNAVIAGETNGYGYSMLTTIANNAIYERRDIFNRSDYYREAEEYVRTLIADIANDVKNGRDYNEAKKAAYTRIYQSVDPNYNPDDFFLVDYCYRDIPAVDAALFNRARKILLEAVTMR